MVVVVQGEVPPYEIGEGVAIPHGALDGIEGQVAALLVCPQGVDFDSLDERPAPDVEQVIVRPDYDYVEKRQLLGNINGERNPTAYTIERPVDYSDLNLADASDRRELRARIHDTAEELCYQLDGRFPQLRGDRSADRECIRNATRNALRDVGHGPG